jgi:hypothetical protein
MAIALILIDFASTADYIREKSRLTTGRMPVIFDNYGWRLFKIPQISSRLVLKPTRICESSTRVKIDFNLVSGFQGGKRI